MISQNRLPNAMIVGGTVEMEHILSTSINTDKAEPHFLLVAK